jgi:hypothetical protein
MLIAFFCHNVFPSSSIFIREISFPNPLFFTKHSITYPPVGIAFISVMASPPLVINNGSHDFSHKKSPLLFTLTQYLLPPKPVPTTKYPPSGEDAIEADVLELPISVENSSFVHNLCPILSVLAINIRYVNIES